MKTLFEYQLPFLTKERVTKKQDDGSELTTVENVEKKIKVIIQEPNRKVMEAAREVYQKSWSAAVSSGILTRAVLDKQYRKADGILTEGEQKNLEQIANRVKEIQTEYNELNSKIEKSESDAVKLQGLVDEFNDVQRQLDALESVNESLYTNSAETIASEKQLAYLVFFLSYIERNGKIESFVPGETLEDKLDSFDGIVDDESNDDKKERARLYSEILTRNSQYINWLTKGKITREQLKEINDSLDRENKPVEEKEVKADVKTDVKSPEVESAVVETESKYK